MKVKQYINLMIALVMISIMFSCTVNVDNGTTGNTTQPPVKYNFSLAIAKDSEVPGEIILEKTTPNGSYVKGTTIVVEATSDAEKTFFGWYDESTDGNLVSRDYSYSFSLEADCALYAKFAPNTIIFEDAALQTVVENAVKTAGIDDTGATTLVNLAKVTSLTYNGGGQPEGIASLKGLEYLVNLQAVELPANQIEKLNSLRNLTELTSIKMKINRISSIEPLRNLSKLSTIEMQINSITDIAVLEFLTMLDVINLSRNLISDISPLINNSGIEQFDSINLSGNSITDDSQKETLSGKCLDTSF